MPRLIVKTGKDNFLISKEPKKGNLIEFGKEGEKRRFCFACFVEEKEAVFVNCLIISGGFSRKAFLTACLILIALMPFSYYVFPTLHRLVNS